MDIEVIFQNASVKELTRGTVIDEETSAWICLVCGKRFTEGLIYQEEGQMMDASFAARYHVHSVHGGMLAYLLSLPRKQTGLTDTQVQWLMAMKERVSDQELAKKMGVTQSTVRGQRFAFREKERQARVQLALLSLIHQKEDPSLSELVAPHRGATMVDERYHLTEKEVEKIIKTYFKEGPQGPLSSFPSKEKRKIAVLSCLIQRFDRKRSYHEREVNDILKEAYHDFVTLRRYLIEYGFMTRTRDGATYQVK